MQPGEKNVQGDKVLSTKTESDTVPLTIARDKFVMPRLIDKPCV